MELRNVFTKPDDLRMVVNPFAGPGIDFAPGQTVLVVADVQAPPSLLQNSESISIEMRTPATVVFDQAALERYEAANRPRPEPEPERWLSKADILETFGWTKAQFYTAVAAAGFPRPTGTRENPPALIPSQATWGEGITSHNVWSEHAVMTWANAARSLFSGMHK
jgi:hypothetical protein